MKIGEGEVIAHPDTMLFSSSSEKVQESTQMLQENNSCQHICKLM